MMADAVLGDMMRDGQWTGWLVDTLIATTCLVLILLLVRRPVARYFGPQLAYALWAIPALRMLLPPLPPLWSEPAVVTAPVASTTELILNGAGLSAPVAVAQVPLLPLWWPLALVAVWGAGVVAHLGWQLLMHHRWMRLLADAETVEWIGPVRIIVSDAIDGPMSFGLRHPVIMLPACDRLNLSPADRALAIDHELAHHRRGDLWANGAALIFAALHWFNPLIRLAWRAFRFDQESACDATVLAHADAPMRGAYARALAKVATGRPAAFSPPMLASPMLGAEKLKERVSMLVQPTRSPARRRLGVAVAVIALIGALGVTATPVLADPPVAPAPPAPPQLPAAPDSIDMAAGPGEYVTRIERNGMTLVFRTDHELDQAEIDRLVAEAHASHAEADHAVAAADASASGAPREMRTIVIRRHADGETVDVAGPVPPMPPAPPAPPARPGERHVIVRTIDGGHAPHAEIRDCEAGSTALYNIDQTSGVGANASRVRILNCVGGTPTPAQRLSAMRQARESLASSSNPDLGEARTAALSELDRLIAQLERDGQ